MKRKTILILSLLLLLLVSCVPKDEGELEIGKNQSEVGSEETNMIEVLRNLVDKNYYCITKLFYFGNLPYDTEEIKENVSYVVSNDFQSFDSLKEYLSDIYVDEEVERLLFRYYEDEPLYIGLDGRLALRVDQVSGAGMGLLWKDYSIEILDNSSSKCLFAVSVEYEVTEEYVGPAEEIYYFSATKEEKWKLDQIVYLPGNQIENNQN